MESTTSPAKRHHPKRLRIIEAKHPLPGAIVSGAPGDLVGLGIGHRVENLCHLLGDHPVEPGLEQVLVDPYDVQGSWFRLLASNRGFVLANENRTQDAGHDLLRQDRNPKVRKNSGVIQSQGMAA